MVYYQLNKRVFDSILFFLTILIRRTNERTRKRIKFTQNFMALYLWQVS